MIKKYALFLGVGFTILSAGFMDSIVKEAGSIVSGSTNTQNNQLVSALTKSLNIDSKQAVGGTAALMGLAASSMPKSDYTNLLKSVPGLESVVGSASPLLGMASGMIDQNSIDKVFKSLGMDPSMVKEFAPILLNYIKPYATPQNISMLQKAWMK